MVVADVLESSCELELEYNELKACVGRTNLLGEKAATPL